VGIRGEPAWAKSIARDLRFACEVAIKGCERPHTSGKVQEQSKDVGFNIVARTMNLESRTAREPAGGMVRMLNIGDLRKPDGVRFSEFSARLST